MGLANSTAGCLGIFVPILLVIFVIWGLLILTSISRYQLSNTNRMTFRSMNRKCSKKWKCNP